MKFSTDRPVKVVMLGAGGTGGYVAPHVFRLLHIRSLCARSATAVRTVEKSSLQIHICFDDSSYHCRKYLFAADSAEVSL